MPLLDARISAAYGQQKVLDGLRLTIERGEILGLVGQSGSGKSTFGLAVLRLLGRRGGSVTGELLFDGADLLKLKEREMRAIRGRRIALVLQSAAAALNPALRLEEHFREAWRAHSRTCWADKREEVLETMRLLDLPASDEFIRRFPAGISIGQAQRVLIALALLHRPELIVADELTSALDLLTAREVLDTLRRVNQIWGTAILFVSHDLGAVATLCHRVAILREGRIIECSAPEELFTRPEQEYTQQLVSILRAVSRSYSTAGATNRQIR